jgi:hypothetical protein
VIDCYYCWIVELLDCYYCLIVKLSWFTLYEQQFSNKTIQQLLQHQHILIPIIIITIGDNLVAGF